MFGDGSWALHGSWQNFQDPSPNIVYAIHGNMMLKEYKLEWFVHSENGQPIYCSSISKNYSKSFKIGWSIQSILEWNVAGTMICCLALDVPCLD